MRPHALKGMERIWLTYSMIHLTCNITNLYCSARKHDRELCNSLFERVFYYIYAIPHPDTYLWCLFCHFYLQNEVSHATNLARKFSFQNVWVDLDHEEERFQVANRDPTGFYQRVFLATKKAIWSPSLKYLLLRQGFKRFKETGCYWKRLAEKDRHTAVSHLNIKHVIL